MKVVKVVSPNRFAVTDVELLDETSDSVPQNVCFFNPKTEIFVLNVNIVRYFKISY